MCKSQPEWRSPKEDIMAIYTKVGDEVSNIRIDGDCYTSGQLIQVWGLVTGQTSPRLLYISDLHADGGKQEIKAVTQAIAKGV